MPAWTLVSSTRAHAALISSSAAFIVRRRGFGSDLWAGLCQGLGSSLGVGVGVRGLLAVRMGVVVHMSHEPHAFIFEQLQGFFAGFFLGSR